LGYRSGSHCERSEAIQLYLVPKGLNCFVALLLAMTIQSNLTRFEAKDVSSARVEERGEPRLDTFGDFLAGTILGVAESAGAGISLIAAGDIVGDA
jgi:hypothetical protein